MKPTVHILATIRKPELVDAALFVFPTLRTGFPSANVVVWGNRMTGSSIDIMAHACGRVNAEFRNAPATSHDLWIESLIERSTEPFWICDTDVIFWSQVEGWELHWLYSGRHEPAFHDEWTDTIHVERLHTCLMYINPAQVRAAMRAWTYRIPEPWRDLAEFPYVRQNFIPRGSKRPLFYDTMAGLYQAMPGQAFTPEQDAAFDHLGCATYVDQVKLSVDLAAAHRAAYAQPELARGAKAKQDRYYAEHKVKGADAI